jgi:hypothetical protein
MKKAFYKNFDNISHYGTVDGLAIVEIEKGEIYSVLIDPITLEIKQIYFNCEKPIMNKYNKAELNEILNIILKMEVLENE